MEPNNDTPSAPQAALQAEQAGYGPQVVVGAFLHDIGDQWHTTYLYEDEIRFYFDAGHIVGLEHQLESMHTEEGVTLGTGGC